MAKPWADGPFKLFETPRKRDLDAGKIATKQEEGALGLASEMVIVHNALIRGLNAIYLQAPNVKLEKDIADFCTFIYSWSLTIKVHHENEESVIFPLLEDAVEVKGLFDGNIEQHHNFEPGLKAFDDYATSVREGKEKYDGAKIRVLIDGFAPILMQHLTEEIPTIEGLSQYDDKIDWKVFNKKLQDHAVGNADKYYEIPFVLTNMDITYEKPCHDKHWPPFPWYVGFMFRWLYVPRHRDAWRFSCCDDAGRPKALPFV